ncbi:MAG: hypothetical protein QM503_02810 [Bacteroidota bacterium]
MKKIINFNNAVLASLFFIGLLILFHLFILVGIIFFEYAPIGFLWGGQMETVEQLLKFEIASLLISILFFFLVLIRSKRLNLPKLMGVTRVAMWVLFVLFLLNTVGNLMATTTFEKFFAIATGFLAFFFLRIALEKNTD